ncbi:MAG: endolytic transglycosylase MltG [Paracoccaceae bacterium]
MWRAIASNALTLFILALVVFAGLLAWGQRSYSAPGPLSSAICFEVQKGASLSTVSRALAERGAIGDPRIFRIGAEYSGRSKELKFGSYLIEAGASMEGILGELTASGLSTCGREVNFRIGVNNLQIVLRELDPTTNRYEDVVKFDPATDAAPTDYLEAKEAPDLRWRITLAEGVTSWNVVDALRRADFMAGDVVEVPPEGVLAPDSYEVTPGQQRGELLAEMARRQEATLQELWASRAEGLPYASPQEALIMASIVEKETGVAEERKLVASVFLNRLAKGMRLQTDPTVIYGITKGEGVLGRGLRQSELSRETPYNTYVIDGMPPTPIANPGRSSIEAALDPAQTDFVFFVADGTGGHAFAVTLEEHNRNVARWREIEAEQKKSESEAAQDGGGG